MHAAGAHFFLSHNYCRDQNVKYAPDQAKSELLIAFDINQGPGLFPPEK